MCKSLKNLRKYLDIEILPIYNNNNVYTAAMAGNIGIEISKTRYVMYVHQDIEFLEKSGKQICDIIDSMDEHRIISGAAGISLNFNNSLISDWGFCSENNRIGKIYDEQDIAWDGLEIINPVHSLDEICLIIDKHSGIRFDTSIDGYHLYGLDICLQARSAGYEVAAGPIDLRHYGKYSSSLYRDHNFVMKLLKMHNKWKLQFPFVYMPYAHWIDNKIVSYLPYVIKNNQHKINVSRISISLE